MSTFVVYLIPLTIAAVCLLVLRMAMLRYRVRRHWFWLVLGNLAVLLASLGVIFLAAETYYRYFYDESDASSLSLSSQRWFDRYYRMNEAGLRDNVEYHSEKPPGVRRLSFVGDSFTAGHGMRRVEDRFANILRRKLAPHCEVHCLARNGLDTGPQIDMLRRGFDGGYRTDAVVLIYCANDLIDLLPQLPGQVERLSARAASIGALRNSYAIDIWHCRWIVATDPDSTNHYQDLAAAYEGELWDRQQARLRELVAVCRERETPLAIVMFPFIDPREMGPYDRAYAKLEAFCRAEDIPYLDLRTALYPHVEEGLIVNAFDAHPNERAHALAAEAILAWLRETLPAVVGP
ncbi:MAG: SGNH/GDSL hydrolase family protein [Pirellulales bacterium]|nr:SGNH/GDSL hydrolase family protein [Pirellulales bacterium]